ncbi:MAG: NUDIX hydrolase [Parcubacteria group bacterium GW2011_GWA2_38_13]|nr:MAG: NUDIX hydrolase [Parcubacteria group bacterium GW2011_GWA2_38_13]
MINQLSAGIVLYIIKNNEPHYLLLQHGGRYWNFPKGKLEKGETELEAAYREVEEETGIQKKDIFLHPEFKVYNYYSFRVEEGRVINKKVTFFLGRVNSSNVFISSEHFSFGWFDNKDAEKKLYYKNSKNEILEKVEEFLARISSTKKTKV